MPATATGTAVLTPTGTSTAGSPTATPPCLLYALPAFDTVPRGGGQALLVEAAPGAPVTLTVGARYPVTATLYTDSSLSNPDGFGTEVTGTRVPAGYRYAFRVEASGLALLTFTIPRTARQGTVAVRVAAQEACGLFKTVTTFEVRGRVSGATAGQATRFDGRAVTLAIALPHAADVPVSVGTLARRGVVRVTTRGRGAAARRVLLLTYHPRVRRAAPTMKAGTSRTPTRPSRGIHHLRPHTILDDTTRR